MTTYSYFDINNYTTFLKKRRFNEDQIKFLIDRRNEFESLKRSKEVIECNCCHTSKEVSTFDYDSYEREMWYTMNRSGLFENEPENKTGITNWNPDHTRHYITEL